MQIIRKNPKLGNYLHYLHQTDARHAGYEQVPNGYHQVQIGVDEETGEPIIGDGDTIYIDGDDLFAADWDEAWGEPPTDEELEAWEEPEPEPPPPVTDVERLAAASTTVFIDKRKEATLFLDKVKGDAHAALVFSGKYDNAAATTEGVKFVEYHTVSLTTFKDCGGHPLAAQRLLTAIMSKGSKSLFDWLNIPAVAAVFENSLTY